VYKRCKYVVEEIKRVADACEALIQGRIEKVGELMYETHFGLRDDYEVSCKELDILVAIAQKSKLAIGARVMGGGFGGCTINIVAKDKLETFQQLIKTEYEHQTGKNIILYNVSIKQGVSII
jgi:galactokinase